MDQNNKNTMMLTLILTVITIGIIVLVGEKIYRNICEDCIEIQLDSNGLHLERN